MYSGELLEMNVWVKGNRIAYVGPRVYEGVNAQVIDATGKVLVPGYIEPHAHPFQLYNPIRYAETILARGTTCSVNDNLVLYMQMEFGQIGRFFEQTSALPIKMMWSVRLDAQSHVPEKRHKFQANTIYRLLKNPSVWQVGEVTDWKSWIDGDEEMRDGALEAKSLRKRVEGHCAGMSYETLNVATAAGVTADHEAINTEDALRRLRLGIWTTLRHSSLRPDLPDILPGLIGELKQWNRVMMTTDGPTPEYLKNGYSDYLIRLAIELGLDPITAYQLVTINPATYYGVDDEIGGIAPGRVADILLLSELCNPTPELVIADGQVVARDGNLLQPLEDPNWATLGLPPLPAIGKVSPEWFDVYTEEETFPVMKLQNPAITRRVDMPVRTEAGRIVDLVESSEDLCYIALLNREGQWVCNGIIQSFATNLAAVASSYTGAGEIVVIGRDKAAMAAAVERVMAIGGGIVVLDGTHNVLHELPLTVGGVMGTQSVDELVAESGKLAETFAEVGHPHYDPVYTLLFLSSTHLPELRLSSEGLFEVKTKRILHPARAL
ncbi:MAG: adenine deaminase C-terminal domain-containing protein [Tumebacillaceae bacterium]